MKSGEGEIGEETRIERMKTEKIRNSLAISEVNIQVQNNETSEKAAENLLEKK